MMNSCYTEKEKARGRRYLREFGLAMLGYAVAVLGGSWILKQFDPSLLTAVLLALLPGVAAVFAVWAVWRHVADMDELQRRLHAQAAVVAVCIFVVVCMVLGFLEDWAGLPHLNPYWLSFGIIMLWSLATMVLTLRFNRPADDDRVL